MESYRPTKAVIDLAAIGYNLTMFRKRAGQAEVIAVVKADAYGHGGLEIANKAVSSGVKLLAVATPDEALYLRRNNVKAEILVMGSVPRRFLTIAQQANIIVTAISLEWLSMAAEAIDSTLPALRVHLKVDTGMRRVGVQVEEVEQALSFLGAERFSLDGIFTHFATADEESGELFHKQVKEMKSVVDLLDDSSVMVHVSNSAAAIMHPDLSYDAVRVGISLYGIAPSPYVREKMPFELQPALSLETEIIHVKKVQAGDTLSYGATYRCEQDEWIATLPIGYADGLLRGLQGQEVLVQGNRVPIVGRICMDQCMIRLPGKMAVGEKVQLIGRQKGEHILIDEWAEKLGTIPYEIPCILTKRIPRIYSDSSDIQDWSFHGADTMVR